MQQTCDSNLGAAQVLHYVSAHHLLDLLDGHQLHSCFIASSYGVIRTSGLKMKLALDCPVSADRQYHDQAANDTVAYG